MKPFKSLEEQVEILKNRNLKFKNENSAKEYLLSYNYYNIINVYSKFFIDNKTSKYYNDVYFEDIKYVHIFDKEVKSIIFQGIIEAERCFKSILAYCYCKEFKGDLYSYLDIKTYNKEQEIIKVSKQCAYLANIINKHKNIKEQNSIKHYYNNHGVVPFWVLVNYLTLGEVTNFYKLLPKKVKNNISKELTLFIKDNLKKNNVLEINTRIIEKGLENLTALRNVVAHNNMLLRYIFKNDLPYYKELHSIYNIKKQDNRQDVYNCILYLQFFIRKADYEKIVFKLKECEERFNKNIKNNNYVENVFKSLGFPICKEGE